MNSLNDKDFAVTKTSGELTKLNDKIAFVKTELKHWNLYKEVLTPSANSEATIFRAIKVVFQPAEQFGSKSEYCNYIQNIGRMNEVSQIRIVLPEFKILHTLCIERYTQELADLETEKRLLIEKLKSEL